MPVKRRQQLARFNQIRGMNHNLLYGFILFLLICSCDSNKIHNDKLTVRELLSINNEPISSVYGVSFGVRDKDSLLVDLIVHNKLESGMIREHELTVIVAGRDYLPLLEKRVIHDLDEGMIEVIDTYQLGSLIDIKEVYVKNRHNSNLLVGNFTIHGLYSMIEKSHSNGNYGVNFFKKVDFLDR